MSIQAVHFGLVQTTHDFIQMDCKFNHPIELRLYSLTETQQWQLQLAPIFKVKTFIFRVYTTKAQVIAFIAYSKTH